MERGNLVHDAKRKPYKLKTKGESIDACTRGGSSRSSDEILVMRMEQRGCVNPKKFKVNREREEP